jgi:alpha-ketoglutarate-dependent taurine dioxygenase
MIDPAEPIGQASCVALGRIVRAPAAARSLLAIDRDHVMRLFKQHGALLFRGFDASADSFRAFTEPFGKSFLVYPGDRRDRVGEDPTVQTVDHGCQAILLHAELSYLPIRPDLCWFHCIRPAAQGGETILCDGVEIARALSPATWRFLEENPIRYVRDLDPSIWRALFGANTTDDLAATIARLGCESSMRIEGDLLHVDVTTPAIGRPRFGSAPAFANNLVFSARTDKPLSLAGGGPLPDDVHDEIAGVMDRLIVEIAWQGGDVLMLDNTRMLHGRRAIPERAGRVVHTRFASVAFA